jgi:sec-independent protein translocase protein TatB
MFDIGFSELVVIAVVALIVIGPERLPKVARTVGHLMGRFQRYVRDVKSDLDREMQLEELRKLQAELQSSAQQVESNVRDNLNSVHNAVADLNNTLHADVATESASAPAADSATAGGEALPAVTANPTVTTATTATTITEADKK